MSLPALMDEKIRAHGMCGSDAERLAALRDFWKEVDGRGLGGEARMQLAARLMQERLLEARRLAAVPEIPAEEKTAPATVVSSSTEPALPVFTSQSPEYGKPEPEQQVAESDTESSRPAAMRPSQPIDESPQAGDLPEIIRLPDPPAPRPRSRKLEQIGARYVALTLRLTGVPGEPTFAAADYRDVDGYCDDLHRQGKGKLRLNDEEEARQKLRSGGRRQEADALFAEEDKYRRLAREVESAGCLVGELPDAILSKYFTRRDS